MSSVSTCRQELTAVGLRYPTRETSTPSTCARRTVLSVVNIPIEPTQLVLLVSKPQDLPFHESNECESRLISCPSGCDGGGGGDGDIENKSGTTATATAVFPARALEAHLMYGCALRLVKCAACGDEVVEKDLDSHKKDACR